MKDLPRLFLPMMLTVSSLAVAATFVALPDTTPVQAATASDDSGTMKRASADMRKVLMKLDELNPKPLGSVEAPEARKQPTPADAVAALLKSEGKDPEKMKQEMGVTTEDTTYTSAGTQIPARIYKPAGADAKALPIIFYIHGGGWVIADLDTYDATPRALAKKANAIVVSVHYRQAPENKFPASHDDTFEAYKWALDKAQSWGADPKKMAIVGESAGGNMAMTVSMAARDNKIQLPTHIVAVYPVASTLTDSPSYQKNENAKPLSKAGMKWFFKNETAKAEDLRDPRLDLVKSADLSKLPATTIITAEIDPLKSDGEMLAERLKAAGVKTAIKNYEGVTHEFFGMDAVVKSAGEAQDFAVQELKKGWSKPTAQN